MVYNFSVPSEYGYVVLTATLSTVVAQWHNIHVGKYRRTAKVAYPNAYASDAEAKENQDKYLFNCAQRSHSNFMEHQPAFLVSLMVGGLGYPVLSAGLGLGWCFARVLYALGYVNKDKAFGKGRYIGNFFWLCEFGLQITAGLFGYKILTNGR